MRAWALLMLFGLLAVSPVPAAGPQDPKPLVCGIAIGFPPYQFQDAQGRPTGIDAEVARLVFAQMGVPVVFVQRSWDDLYLGLAHRTGEVDTLCGAEINTERQSLFSFSEAYYRRSVAVFVKADSPFRSIEDLAGRPVAGDRGGLIETLIPTDTLRMLATESKEASFDKLGRGTASAVIAPVEVGRWVSRERGVAVRLLPVQDPGSPVAFAVSKGNRVLADRISAALAVLKARGQIDAIIKRYR